MKHAVYRVEIHGSFKAIRTQAEWDAHAEPFIKVGATCEPFKGPDEGEDPEDYSEYFHLDSNMVMQASDLVLCAELGIPVTVKQKLFLDIDPAEIFRAQAEKLELLQSLPEGVAGNTYNNRCEVHMPGNLMATYNEVLLLEDGCSDALQEELNRGWRLISACPQPDSRRPDYVLGRYSPKSNLPARAFREGDS